MSGINYAKITLIAVVFIVLVASFAVYNGKSAPAAVQPSADVQVKHFKILHVMSYHTPWEWTEDQLTGFKEQLEDADVEYRVYEMDTKRNSSEEHKLAAGAEARAIIDSWKPDLLYTTDDNAQKYVAKYYVNSSMPVVFGAVNADPSVYGFRDSTNVAGVMEEEHAVQTVKLLREIVPNATRIVAIIDDDPSWISIVNRTAARVVTQFPDVQIIQPGPIHTVKEFKANITYYQTRADAFLLIGVHTFKNENNTNMPFEDALRWVTENSMLPDITFWKDRIPYGTLATVSVSGYEQGIAAGKIARGILMDGQSPSSFPVLATVKGDPYISFARAEKLGISIDSSILLTANVINTFEWEKQ